MNPKTEGSEYVRNFITGASPDWLNNNEKPIGPEMKAVLQKLAVYEKVK